jgi:hypothetical protein
MNRSRATSVVILVIALVAILVVGGNLWATSGLEPPSNDMVEAAYRQAQADGSLFWDKDTWIAWSVPGTDGHEWTCRVHLDWIYNLQFAADPYHQCSPWPWAGWFRGGAYRLAGQ